MKKEAYEHVEIDVYRFEVEDVITESVPFNPDSHEGSPVSG